MPKRQTLVSGPLSMEFSDGDLRNVRYGSTEIVNRIYFALRDQNWGTVKGIISDLSIEQNDSGFVVTYRSEHHAGDIHFAWNCEIKGYRSGRVSFSTDGSALSTFNRNRIGLCLLHPASAAGDKVTITHSDDSNSHGVFPELVSPHQPFRDIRSIHHVLHGGSEADIVFSGDIFEMEDQRNWTDATYKTYCTPLSLPFPVEVQKGTKVKQSIDIVFAVPGEETSSIRAASEDDASRPGAVVVNVARMGSGPHLRLPKLGLAYGHSRDGLSAHARNRLLGIKPSFLNLELLISEENWQSLLRAAAKDSLESGIPLGLTLRSAGDTETCLEVVLATLKEVPADVAFWTVLSEGALVSQKEDLEIARRLLAPYGGGRPIGGGTRAFFAELNRNHPPFELLDFVSYTINPQVHAFDDVSIVETLDGQRASARSAAALGSETPVHVGAVTLRPQWNPNATAPAPPPPPGELPPEVDPRQRTAFAAAWTLGSIKALAESAVQSVTFYEVEGWKGIMELPSGSPLPAKFPSGPNELFPVFQALLALAAADGQELYPSSSTEPLAVEALALRSGERCRVFLLNYTDRDQDVVLQGVGRSEKIETIVADEQAAATAAPVEIDESGSLVKLTPHMIVAFDCLP